MNKAIIVGGLAAVVAAAAAVGVFYVPGQLLRSEIDARIEQLPDSITASYRNSDYSLLQDEATISGVTIAAADGSWGPVTIDKVEITLPTVVLTEVNLVLDGSPSGKTTVSRLELTNPTLDFFEQFEQAREDPGAFDMATKLPVADKIDASGVTVEIASNQETGTTDIQYNLARTTIDGLRVYPAALLQFDGGSFAMALEGINEEIEETRPEGAEQMLAKVIHFYAAIYLGFGYDAANLAEIAVSVAAPQVPEEEWPFETDQIGITYDQFSDSGFDRGVYKGSTTTGITYDFGTAAQCKNDKLSVKPFDVRAFAERALANPEQWPPQIDDLRFEGFTMTDFECDIEAVGPVRLGALSFGSFRFKDSLPVAGQFAVTDFTLTSNLLAMAGPENPLAYVGLDDATISISAAYDFKAEEQKLVIKDILLKVTELGTLNFKTTLIDVTALDESIQGAKIADARLEYTDASLVDRLLTAFAQEQNADPAEVRDHVRALIVHQATAQEVDPSITQQVVDFLESPKSLTIELLPPVPVSVAFFEGIDLVPPSVLIKTLGLQVTANN